MSGTNMTGLFISIDDYLIDPVEEDIMRSIHRVIMEEEYYFIPSAMNKSRRYSSDTKAAGIVSFRVNS